MVGSTDNTLPTVTITPGLTVAVTRPPNLLPDYPGKPDEPKKPSDPKKTFVITRYGAAPKPPPRIGPNSDPEIPYLLQDIDYKPLPTARLGVPYPPGYGRYAIGGKLVRAKKWGSDLMAVMVWGDGGTHGFDAIEKVYAADVDITINTGVKHYLGTAGQTPNSAVASQFGQADALPGVVYSVLQLYPGLSLDIWAIVRARKVYDPRNGNTVYSNNAALCAADFAANFTDYDTDRSDFWDSVKVAAKYCDEWADAPANKIRRWQVNMPLETQKSPDEWLKILAEYANCYIFPDDGTIKFLPDQPRAVDHELTAKDIRAGTFDLRKSGQRDTPTQVFGTYTLPAVTGIWGTDSVQTDDPDESVPLRITTLRLDGYQEKLQAKRKVIQFQNYAAVSDLFANFETFDRGAKITRGDVISITHPVGLNKKEFRVLECEPVDRGRWRIDAREYSPLMHSDEVVANPDVPDTDLPRVEDEPTPANLVLLEELYAIEPGETRSRLIASCDVVNYPFQHSYEWQVLQDSVELLNASTNTPKLIWGPLPIDGNVTYTVKVRIRGPVGEGDPASETILIQGKLALPLPPSVFRVFEAQGTVFFSWTPGLDIDLRGYEIRYGSSSDAWDDMDLVNRWGIAAAGETSLVAPGTWTFELRSFDSIRTLTNPVGQYSATGIRKEITVTTDANSFHVNDYPLTFDATDSSGVRLVKSTYWTDSGESWLDVFGTDPLTGLDQPIISYLTNTASVWASAAVDFGQSLSLTLGVTPGATAVVGTVDTFIETKVLIGDAWTRHTQDTVKATGRYARVVYETAATSRIKVGPDGYGTLHADVIANETKGDVTTDGISPTTVTLPAAVAKFRFLSVTAIGTGVKAKYDNLVTGSPATFDVHFLDESTNLPVVASGFYLAQYY